MFVLAISRMKSRVDNLRITSSFGKVSVTTVRVHHVHSSLRLSHHSLAFQVYQLRLRLSLIETITTPKNFTIGFLRGFAQLNE